MKKIENAYIDYPDYGHSYDISIHQIYSGFHKKYQTQICVWLAECKKSMSGVEFLKAFKVKFSVMLSGNKPTRTCLSERIPSILAKFIPEEDAKVFPNNHLLEYRAEKNEMNAVDSVSDGTITRTAFTGRFNDSECLYIDESEDSTPCKQCILGLMTPTRSKPLKC